MSLIRIRNNRKKNWLDHKKTTSTRKLVIGFLLVAGAIWYLTYLF